MNSIDPDKDMRLPFYTGWLAAALTDKYTKGWLNERGVTDAEIESAYDAIMQVAKAFYYEPTESRQSGAASE